MNEPMYEGWKNQDTWAVALFIDNYSLDVLHQVCQAAHEASLLRNPSLSFSIRAGKIIDRLPGCPLWRHSSIYWGELLDHYLTKYHESEEFKLLEWYSGITKCGQCGENTLNKELAWWSGAYWCPKCYHTLFKECPVCHRKIMGVKAGREYWDDEARKWDGHAHTFSETERFFEKHPKLVDPEEMCEDCFDKKHGIVSVLVKF